MSLSQEIQDALSVLARGSESVRAVLHINEDGVMADNKPENRFTKALESLQQLSEQHGVPIAIVGGLGAIRYGYPAATQDIDVAIGRNQLDFFMDLAPRFGFKIAWWDESGWHTLIHGDVEINVVPQGGKARSDSPTTIPGPQEMGVLTGLGYASLCGWVELKISSGRQKDYAHIVEVLKKSKLSQIQQIRNHIGSIHDIYLATLDRLILEADQEKRQEQSRIRQ
jgi:hypothetical protein